MAELLYKESKEKIGIFILLITDEIAYNSIKILHTEVRYDSILIIRCWVVAALFRFAIIAFLNTPLLCLKMCNVSINQKTMSMDLNTLFTISGLHLKTPYNGKCGFTIANFNLKKKIIVSLVTKSTQKTKLGMHFIRSTSIDLTVCSKELIINGNCFVKRREIIKIVVKRCLVLHA